MAAFAGPIVRTRLLRRAERATKIGRQTVKIKPLLVRGPMRAAGQVISSSALLYLAGEPSKRAEREWDVGSRTPASQTREVVRK